MISDDCGDLFFRLAGNDLAHGDRWNTKRDQMDAAYQLLNRLYHFNTNEAVWPICVQN